MPRNRYPFRVNGSTTFTSVLGFELKLRTVCGDSMSAKTRWVSSQTVSEPFGETFGDPSGEIDDDVPEPLVANELFHLLGQHGHTPKGVDSRI